MSRRGFAPVGAVCSARIGGKPWRSERKSRNRFRDRGMPLAWVKICRPRRSPDQKIVLANGHHQQRRGSNSLQFRLSRRYDLAGHQRDHQARLGQARMGIRSHGGNLRGQVSSRRMADQGEPADVGPHVFRTGFQNLHRVPDGGHAIGQELLGSVPTSF